MELYIDRQRTWLNLNSWLYNTFTIVFCLQTIKGNEPAPHSDAFLGQRLFSLTLHGRSTALNCAITTIQYQPYKYRRILYGHMVGIKRCDWPFTVGYIILIATACSKWKLCMVKVIEKYEYRCYIDSTYVIQNPVASETQYVWKKWSSRKTLMLWYLMQNYETDTNIECRIINSIVMYLYL